MHTRRDSTHLLAGHEPEAGEEVGRIAISVMAMLALNFFFLPPFGTLTIADPQNWVALVAFLAAAATVSRWSAVARTRAADAVARRNELARLYDLSRDVLLTTESGGAIDLLARRVALRFELPALAICLPQPDGGWRSPPWCERDLVVADAVLFSTLAAAARKATSATQFCGSAMVSVPSGGRKKKLRASIAMTEIAIATQSRAKVLVARTTTRSASADVVALTSRTAFKASTAAATSPRPARRCVESRRVIMAVSPFTPAPARRAPRRTP